MDLYPAYIFPFDSLTSEYDIWWWLNGNTIEFKSVTS